MNHTDLIKQLRDASAEMLKDVESRICESTTVWPQFIVDTRKLIAEADAHLKSGGWVRVEDALPVVPEGEHAVAIAVFGGADVIRTYWQAKKTSFVGNYSHWRPDPLPNPPEQAK